MARLRARRFSSSLVPFLLTLLRRQGVDPSPLERRYLHLSPTGEGAVVGLSEIEGLFESAATLTKDPDFGLHAALAMPRGGYGLVEFALRSAPTVRVAVEQLGRFGALINPLVRWSAEADGDEVTLRHQPHRQKGVGRQANVFTVVRILQIAREMAGAPLSPRRVWFATTTAPRRPRCAPSSAPPTSRSAGAPTASASRRPTSRCALPTPTPS